MASALASKTPRDPCYLLILDMVPNNSQALLAVLPSKTFQNPLPKRQIASMTVMDPLSVTLANALHSGNPLADLAEGVGTRLAVDACLFIGRLRETESITLTLWRAQLRPQVWEICSGLPMAIPSAQLALTLIRQADRADEPDWQERLQQLVEAEDEGNWLAQMRSHLCIPLNTTAEIEGFILLMGQNEGSCPKLTETLEEEVACLMALALHQHHLHQQARRSIDQLRYLNQLKDDFLSTLNHELRTPLTSMMLAIRMLRRPDLTPDRKAMYLDILEQQCSRETALVNDLLTLQTIDSGSTDMTLSSINLNHFLCSLVTAQEEIFSSANLGLCLEMPQRRVTLETEPNHLTRILQELLTNARKYAEPGTVVTLLVESDSAETGNSITLKLINQGTSIQPEELPHIFDKFRRGQGVTQRAIPGTGTGLALVKGLVQQMQGQISVTSQPISQESIWQTCFTLCLPRYAPQSLAIG
ncbi:MAG TPA: HAMP domain-containing sensor histidine kinase [Trichocoleus sp.]